MVLKTGSLASCRWVQAEVRAGWNLEGGQGFKGQPKSGLNGMGTTGSLGREGCGKSEPKGEGIVDRKEAEQRGREGGRGVRDGSGS